MKLNRTPPASCTQSQSVEVEYCDVCNSSVPESEFDVCITCKKKMHVKCPISPKPKANPTMCNACSNLPRQTRNDTASTQTSAKQSTNSKGAIPKQNKKTVDTVGSTKSNHDNVTKPINEFYEDQPLVIKNANPGTMALRSTEDLQLGNEEDLFDEPFNPNNIRQSTVEPTTTPIPHTIASDRSNLSRSSSKTQRKLDKLKEERDLKLKQLKDRAEIEQKYIEEKYKLLEEEGESELSRSSSLESVDI